MDLSVQPSKENLKLEKKSEICSSTIDIELNRLSDINKISENFVSPQN